MQAPAANILPFLVVIPLIAWRMYSRMRRSIGRQTFSKVRPWFTITLFPLLAALVFSAPGADVPHRPALLLALLGGVVGGVVLGIYGLRHTKFEATAEGMFYTPNAHIGIAISTLLVLRVIYRMVVMSTTADPAAAAFSPLTLGIFGLMAGYYVTYAIGLVRWGRSAVVSAPVAEPANKVE